MIPLELCLDKHKNGEVDQKSNWREMRWTMI